MRGVPNSVALIFVGYLYIHKYIRLSKFALQQILFRNSWPLSDKAGPLPSLGFLGQCQKGNLPLICFQPFIGSFHVPLFVERCLTQFTRPTGCSVGLGLSQPSNLLETRIEKQVHASSQWDAPKLHIHAAILMYSIALGRIMSQTSLTTIANNQPAGCKFIEL